MMDNWPAMRKWNLDFFSERFGDREIEVQMGRNAGGNYEIEREKFISKIKFSRFIEMIRSSDGTNDFYLTANNNSSNKSVLPELWDDIIQIPEYLDGSDRFGGFFWMGPRGTITPFHHDLTNNFMAQVIGRKRVRIAPSWDMPLMKNDYHVFCRVDGRVTGPNPRPHSEEPQILECMLNPGEVLFLPIGCLHFVEGVETSVTISFTNFVFDNNFSSFYSTYHRV
jgi:Cupin-like domain